MSLEDVEPPEDGALVVSRTAADEAAGLLVNDKLERLSVPSVALLCLQGMSCKPIIQRKQGLGAIQCLLDSYNVQLTSDYGCRHE